MIRITTHIDTQSSDFCHTVGQALLKPASTLFGLSYKIEPAIEQLPDAHLYKRIAVAALAVLLLPVTAAAFLSGGLLLSISTSHKKAFKEIAEPGIRVIWKDGLPEIRTQRMTLRPIQEGDLPFYKGLFNNPVAMAKYAGGVRDITDRFHGWLKRWKEHSFSALAVVESKSDKVIGHMVSGHGDYEGNLAKGWSEMAVVIDPAFWNSEYTHDTTGSAGLTHIGSEVFRASIAYAKSLRARSIPVPSDVTAAQRPELEAKLLSNDTLKVHRNDKEEIDWVYLPFTELRATASRENHASHKILERIFVAENGAKKTEQNQERDLFTIVFTT